MFESKQSWRRFFVVFLPPAVIVVLAVFLIGQAWIDGQLDHLRTAESFRVQLGATELVRGLKKVPQHLASLPTEKAVRDALDNQTPESLAGLADAFTSLLQRNPEYDQARWIDETGMERVRVNRSDDGASVVVVPREQLQNKADRKYFTESVGLDVGAIYISQLDLNVDNGKVSIPYRPTLRFATAIADHSGARRGILVINYLAEPLLHDFVTTTVQGGRPIMLLNRQGYWLSNPDHQMEWGFMFARPLTMGDQYPALWNAISRARSGQSFEESGLWTWQTTTISPERTQHGTIGPTWIVTSHVGNDVVQSLDYSVWSMQALVGSTLVALFAALAWIVSRHAVREEAALQARARAEAIAADGEARVAALEETQAVRARLAAIIDSTLDAIVGKNLDGVITSWNTGAERLFGYPAEEAIGQSVHILLLPGQEQQEQQILDRISRGEVIPHFETQRRHKDGHRIDVSVTISPIRDAAGFVVGASKIARDITTAKHVEAELNRHRENLEELVRERTAQIAEATERLRDREKFIRTVTDNLPGMVGYWDRQLRCRFANRTYFDWFGRLPEQTIGLTFQELLGEEIFQSSRLAIEAVLSGIPQQLHREIRKPSGEIGYALAHYIPDRDGGAVVGFFALVTDVTALKRAENELRETNDRLADALSVAQEASLAKSHFLANMSHEIRTPMNGVIGMLEILGYTKLDDEQRRMIGTVDSSARSLLEIINDILDFSKIEAGQLKIEFIATDPTEIIESTTRLFLGAATAKRLVLRCFVAPAIRGLFLIDPVRLRQILSNLVSNAIKFTASGCVTIAAEIVGGGDRPASLLFAVKDTGIGISLEAQARLFQPFTQADDTTARNYGGTGLGLSICLRLAGLMGGKIELQSALGEGTEVMLTLAAQSVERDVDAVDLKLSRIKVALVTSDETEQHFLAGYLAHWGAEVTVISPEAPIASLPEEIFTLVLAPASAMGRIRSLTEGAGGLKIQEPRRFVFYVYEDVPADWNPETDSITTTALSRARIITAVAIAAGRKSPEVELVQALPTLAQGTSAPSRDQAVKTGKLILLAEDHPVNRDVVLRQLRLLGYAADAVEDGMLALAALARTRYALLLTDCSMPRMDGYTLSRQIRLAETGRSHLPIIALTANAMEGEDKKCFAAGMDGYLAKPVELATLRACLERWLSAETSNSHANFSPPRHLGAPNGNGSDRALNLTTLMDYYGDDPVAIRESLRLYMDTLRADLLALSDAVARSDAEEAQLFAHRMKGAASVVGGRDLADCSAAIELAAGNRDMAAVERRIPDLLGAVKKVEEMYGEISSA